MPRRKVFRLVLIKPSHYDDDGYVIQWARSIMPSNSLACLYGLAGDCAERRVLGPDVDFEIEAIDETNTRVRPHRIARSIAAADGGMVGLVGVQSNQFPRAVDIARPLRQAGIPVAIGGFHVSGCLAMLPELPADIKEAMALGISIFAGEAEGRLDEVLRDAWAGALKPLYNYMDDLPGMEGAVVPILPPERIRRAAGAHTTFDAGRGCPFQCSFCTIINVQGRKSRFRSADDVERIIRANHANGIRRFFITDDNFARNRNWEAIFDRMIALRQNERIKCTFIIQVDTLCHRIPGFIEKAARAGCRRVFIGLENINPDNLASAKKRQNKITEYRAMLQAWKRAGALTYCGYILGFPTDTPERILGDIEIIKEELPVDVLEFFFLTPLPGSEDHKRLAAQGVAMDPDMNKYDLEHATTAHPLMSKQEWEDIYRRVWDAYYTPEHIERIMRRAAALGVSTGYVLGYVLVFGYFYRLEGVHPLQSGLFRRKYRKDRRPGLPLESPLTFYPRYAAHLLRFHWAALRLWQRYRRIRLRIKADPDRLAYRDLALMPVEEESAGKLALFNASDAARAQLEKKREHERRHAPAAE